MAEKEPLLQGESKERKKFRKLPPAGSLVDADAVYLGDGTAWKLPGLSPATIVCLCEDGEWKFELIISEPLPLDRIKAKEWKEGEEPPDRWPSGETKDGPYRMPPYQGPPPQEPKPPLNPVDVSRLRIFDRR